MTSDPSADFTIRLDSGGRVEAWSTRRLPFEPRGAMLEFRNGLRSTLGDLDAGDGRLHCIYSSASTALCDAENVLLYNVGLSSFSALTRRGVVFERSYDLPTCPDPLSGPALHHHLYAVDSAGTFLHWDAAARAASFRARVPQRADKPSDWWLAALSSMRDGGEEPDLTGKMFGLRIRLGQTSRSLIGMLKPMLDGIVAAMHCDLDPDVTAVGRLAGILGLGSEEVRTKLNGSASPLGRRRLVWPFREGMQWNPADELCVACDLRFDDRLEPGTFEGELLHVSPL